tara:strand:+ start:51 stop:710 length:660 start_codon:yes stop_codon:yes gene_type:complete
MNKIISIIFGASLLLTTFAQAEGMIGIKYGTGELDATKKAYTAGDTDYASASKAKSHEYGAIFAELEIPTVEGLSLGIEVIPFTATIMLENPKEAQTGAELSDHTTIYGSYMYGMGNGSVYVKAGYAMADIGAITQTSNASVASAKTTINSQDNKMEGPMIGIGFQSNELTGGFVARVEATYTDYDDISVTTTSNGSTSVKKTAEAELTTLSISLAKTF